MVPVRNSFSRHFNRCKAYIRDEDEDVDKDENFLPLEIKSTSFSEERDSASTLLMLNHTNNNTNDRHVIGEVKKNHNLEEAEEEEFKILQDMDRRGELNQVIGSQSLLSQEIISFDNNECNHNVNSNKFHNIHHSSSSQPPTTSETSSIGGCYQQSMLSSQQPVIVPPTTRGRLVVTENICYDEIAPVETNKACFEDWKRQYIITSTSTSDRADNSNTDNFNHLPEDLSKFNTVDMDISSPHAREVSDCDDNLFTDTSDDQIYEYIRSLNDKSDMKDLVSRLEANRIEKEGKRKKKKRNYDNSRRLKQKLQKQKKELEELEYAKKSAIIAKQVLDCPKLNKQLLLAMVLSRENPRTTPYAYPPKGTNILKGFSWGQYQPLESFLRKDEIMKEYYSLSVEKCQTKAQQNFNNKLVKLIREEAQRFGWNIILEDKDLRDRIRCFFKTHIQNAKKRMKTMLKNPTKKANAKALAALMDLIEQAHDLNNNNSNSIKTNFPSESNIGTPLSVSKELNSIREKDKGEGGNHFCQKGYNSNNEDTYRNPQVQSDSPIGEDLETIDKSDNNTSSICSESYKQYDLETLASPLKKRKQVFSTINRYQIKRTNRRKSFPMKNSNRSKTMTKDVFKDDRKEPRSQCNLEGHRIYGINSLENDSEAHDDAKHVLALGFSRLSQDDEIVKNS